jgi:hypothetical protein
MDGDETRAYNSPSSCIIIGIFYPFFKSTLTTYLRLHPQKGLSEPYRGWLGARVCYVATTLLALYL